MQVTNSLLLSKRDRRLDSTLLCIEFSSLIEVVVRSHDLKVFKVHKNTPYILTQVHFRFKESRNSFELYILQNLEYRTIKEPNMVQKRMTRSLILLSFVLDVRRVEGHAHTHILAIIPEIHRCVLELLSEKSQIVRRWKKGILKSQFSNFMLRVSFPLLLPNMKVYWSWSPFRKQSSRIFFSCCFLHLPDFANFSFYRVILGGKA